MICRYHAVYLSRVFKRGDAVKKKTTAKQENVTAASVKTPDDVTAEKTSDDVKSEETSDDVKSEETSDSVKSEETSDDVKSEETPDTVKSEETSDEVKSEETPDTVKSEETSDTVKSEETPDSVKAEETSDDVKAEETVDSVKAEETSDDVKAEETSDSVKPAKESVKSASLLKTLGRFFGNPANFRLIFFLILYCDIRYLYYPAYMCVLAVMALWSLGLMIYEMGIKRHIVRVKFRRILFVFLVFATLSVVLRWQDNLLLNIMNLHWIAVGFFLFYGIHAEKSNRKVRHEMTRLFDILIVITNLTMLIGLILFAIFPKGFSLLNFDFVIIEGRFVGLIPNANVTAFYSAAAIVLSVLLLRMRRADKTSTTKRKLWYIGGIILNGISLILTDSNATMVLMMVFLSFLFFYELFKDFSRKKLPTMIFRLAATLLACVLVVATLLMTRGNVQNAVSAALMERDSSVVISTDLNAADDNIKLDGTTLSPQPDTAHKLLGHQNTNIDSGRFVLWRQALGLIELYPLLGVGKENIALYGVRYLGGIRYTDLGGHQYVDFHNALLTITASFGIVGLALFLVMAFTIAKALLRSVFRHKIRSRRDGNVLLLIVAFCVGYSAYSMFEVAMFADCTYRVYLFWLLLGFGMSYVMKYHWQGLHAAMDPTPLHDDTSEFSYLLHKFFHFRRKKDSTPKTDE